PELLHLDYAFDIFGQAHQQVIHLFDTLAAGQRVSLGQEQLNVIHELQDFVQQDIETAITDKKVSSELSADKVSAEPETVSIEPVAVSEPN
ncbi:hypothetical protein, partial [Pseudomonas aeruginosa]